VCPNPITSMQESIDSATEGPSTMHATAFSRDKGLMVAVLCLRPSQTGETEREKAEAWAKAHLPKSDQPILTNTRLTFIKYTQGWWKPEHEYIQRQKSRGHTLSLRYLEECRRLLKKHFYRFQGMKLSEITRGGIDSWLSDLRQMDGYSASTANHCLIVMRQMLGWAVFKGLIPFNPANEVQPHIERHEERKIPATIEVHQLLNEETWAVVWEGNEVMFSLIFVACATGMRMGEIQALERQYINEDYISVRHAWKRSYGLGGTKSAAGMRDIPIPARAALHLGRIMDASPHKSPDDLVFFANLKRHRHGTRGKQGKVPISHKWIEQRFYEALERIGVDHRSRHICFHSLRHWYNTSMRSIIPDYLLRSVVGHTTAGMTERYFHPTKEDRALIAAAHNRLLA